VLEVKVQILDVRGFRACLAGYVMNAFGFFWSLGPSQNPKKEEFSNNPMFVPKMCVCARARVCQSITKLELDTFELN